MSTDDHLWNSLCYPTQSRLIISNNIQVIFGIVVVLLSSTERDSSHTLSSKGKTFSHMQF